MSSRQARAVSLKFCNAPCTMQALLRKGFVTTQAVSFRFCYDPGGAGRFRCASTDTAGSAGARPGLQGLLAASRAIWDVSPAVLHRAVVLAVTLRVGDNSQPPTLFFVYKTCYFPFCTSGTVGLLYRHAQSTPCAARAKKDTLFHTRHRGYIRPTFDLISGNLPIHSPQSSRSMRFV